MQKLSLLLSMAALVSAQGILATDTTAADLRTSFTSAISNGAASARPGTQSADGISGVQPLFYDGALTTDSLTFDNPGGSASGSGIHYYCAQEFTVDATGTYVIETASPNTVGIPSNALDTYLRLYANTFNPAAPAGALLSNDDFTGALTVLPGPYAGTITATATGFAGAQPSSRFATANLTAATPYFLVQTSFRQTNYVNTTTADGQSTGPFFTGIGGPGNITLVGTGCAAPAGGDPVIDVDPASLASTQAPDTVTQQTLTIGNTGTADLDWTVVEAASSSMPMNVRLDVAQTSVGDPSLLAAAFGSAGAPVETAPSAPMAPSGGSINLTLDDGVSEDAIGLTGGAQIIWFNRFTPAPGDFPFTLDEVQVQFRSATGVNVGELFDVYVYSDADGNPANGATFVDSSLGLAVAALDTFGSYPVSIDLTGPGDVLIAVVNRTAGTAASTFPAAIDQTATQGRSWIGSYGPGVNPGNPPALPATGGLYGTIDSFGLAGNWLIRGLGTTGGGPVPADCDAPSDIGWASVSPAAGTTAPGGSSDVTVSFDSAGLAPGDYSGLLCVNSNDPVTPRVEVPVDLTVVAGGDDVVYTVDPTTLSSTQATNTTTTETLTLSNAGIQTGTFSIVEAAAAAPNGGPGVLFDNGSLVTAPGAGAGGADASVLQDTSLGLTLFGFGASSAAAQRMADDFTVDAAGGWDIDTLTFYTYQTGSTTTSTITSVTLRIWDGIPGDAGSNVVFGDTTTNVLASTGFSNIYRTLESTGTTNTQRPIMEVVATADVTLPPGDYWVDYDFTGTLASGPWAPPVTILGQTVTGNARQFAGGVWAAAVDGASGQGVPFLVEGTVAGGGGGACDPVDAPWLSVAPTSGTTPAGGSSDVTVSYDSTGLADGLYEATVCVLSNDSVGNEEIEVPVSLTVTGGGGGGDFDLEVTLALDNGDPAQCGTASSLTVNAGDDVNFCYTVTNNSTETLNFHTLDDSIDGNIFSNFPQTLPPGADFQFNRIVTADTSATYTGTWTAATALPGYTADDTVPFNFIDISSTGTALNLTDDSEANITLPFQFEFYGASSDTLRVGNNGGLLFGVSTGDLGFTNSALPAGVGIPAAASVILPFWDDFDDESGNVFWQVQGTAPNRVAIVQWHNRPHFDAPQPPTPDTGTVQVLLFEGTNAIVFQYQDTIFTNPEWDNGASATVGLQTAGGAAGTANQYSFDEAVITNGLAIEWTVSTPISFTDVDSVSLDVGAPVITVDPTAIVAAVDPGQTATETLLIGNDGDRDLEWDIEEAAGESLPLSGGPRRSDNQNPVPAMTQAAYDKFKMDRVAGIPSPATDVRSLFDTPIVQAMNPAPMGAFDCDGTPGIILHDDGTPENGYGFNGATVTTGQLVDKFTPSGYPSTFTDVCIAFVSLQGANLDFDIVVYDDDGAGGTPGTVLGSLPVSTTTIPIGTPIQLVWQSFDISSLGLEINDGSVYIGARWDPSDAGGQAQRFVASDETASTPLHEGYFQANADPWLRLGVDVNPTYRSLFVRAVEGQSGCALPEDISWLSVSPTSGTVAVGEPDDSVTVTLNSAGLADGVYLANVCVNSNDPETPTVAVPVEFTVGEPPPDDTIFANGFECATGFPGCDGGGTPGVFTDRTTFLENVSPGFYDNPFANAVPGASPPLSYTGGNGFAYTVDASTPAPGGGLFNDTGVISTNQAADQIVVTFTGAPVTAVGGNFWATDIAVLPTGTDITITLSDGTVETFTSTGPTDFRGFVTAAPITSISIEAPDGAAPAWSTLDNLIVGD